jgi:hypothetical protein
MAFSNVINRCGSYLIADIPVIIRGRLTVREDRDPQIMCDDVLPLDGYLPEAEGNVEKRDFLREPVPVQTEKLYLKIDIEDSGAAKG